MTLSTDIRKAAMEWPSLVLHNAWMTLEAGLAMSFLVARTTEAHDYLYEGDTTRRTFWLLVAEAMECDCPRLVPIGRPIFAQPQKEMTI